MPTTRRGCYDPGSHGSVRDTAPLRDCRGRKRYEIRSRSNENMSFTVTPRHEIDGVEMDIGTDRKDFMTMSILGLIFSYIRQVIKK